MNNFMFYSPTRFIFGKGEEMNVGNYISQYGARKVMVLHYGTDFEFEKSLHLLTRLEFLMWILRESSPILPLRPVTEALRWLRKNMWIFCLR